MYRFSWNVGTSTSWTPLGLSRPVMGLLYVFTKYLLRSEIRNFFIFFSYILLLKILVEISYSVTCWYGEADWSRRLAQEGMILASIEGTADIKFLILSLYISGWNEYLLITSYCKGTSDGLTTPVKCRWTNHINMLDLPKYISWKKCNFSSRVLTWKSRHSSPPKRRELLTRRPSVTFPKN